VSYLSVGIDWKYPFPVDPVFSIIVNVAYLKSDMDGKEVIVTLIGPSGDIKQPNERNVSQTLFGYSTDYAVISLFFIKPDPGMWSIVLSVKGRASGEPQKAMTWINFNSTTMTMMAYAATTNNMLYKEISVDAFVMDNENDKMTKDFLLTPKRVGAIKNSTMMVSMPNGDEVMQVMKDSTGDMEGTFMPVIPGVYSVTVDVEGEEDGYQFARTSSFEIPVAAPSLNVTEQAQIQLFYHPITLGEIVLIRVNVSWDETANPIYNGYAEVYGTGSSGERVAVAWVGGLVEVKRESSGFFIQFELDSRWLIKAQATFPLSLKNIVFQDVSGYISIVHVKEETFLKIADARIHTWKPMYSKEQISVTYEMLNGYNPQRDRYLNSTEIGTVVLVHGYCASVDPFPLGHFSNARVFRRLGENLSINRFAQLVLNFIDQEGIGPFSIVAHSQGGMVGAHLLQYYRTSMDALIGRGRLVQSVGTPYGGTPAAGGIATVARFFGVGCGSNSDLIPSGARSWQSGISDFTRQNVFYYTTQYGSGFLRDFCIPGSSIALNRPNDGVVELERSHLTGATHVDHSTRECHIDYLVWPAQTRNAARNSEMNRLAAR
jgi:pimeloyl-ACP methyl ester carboxylesterase